MRIPRTSCRQSPCLNGLDMRPQEWAKVQAEVRAETRAVARMKTLVGRGTLMMAVMVTTRVLARAQLLVVVPMVLEVALQARPHRQGATAKEVTVLVPLVHQGARPHRQVQRVATAKEVTVLVPVARAQLRRRVPWLRV